MSCCVGDILSNVRDCFLWFVFNGTILFCKFFLTFFFFLLVCEVMCWRTEALQFAVGHFKNRPELCLLILASVHYPLTTCFLSAVTVTINIMSCHPRFCNWMSCVFLSRILDQVCCVCCFLFVTFVTFCISWILPNGEFFPALEPRTVLLCLLQLQFIERHCSDEVL